MVEVDRGDHCQLRHHYVGGIQAAAHSNFQDCNVDVCLLEEQERHRRHGFEVCGVALDRATRQELLRNGVYRSKSLGELLSRDRLATDLYALSWFDQ